MFVAKLAFLVVFENVVFIIKALVQHFMSHVPSRECHYFSLLRFGLTGFSVVVLAIKRQRHFARRAIGHNTGESGSASQSAMPSRQSSFKFQRSRNASFDAKTAKTDPIKDVHHDRSRRASLIDLPSQMEHDHSRRASFMGPSTPTQLEDVVQMRKKHRRYHPNPHRRSTLVDPTPPTPDEINEALRRVTSFHEAEQVYQNPRTLSPPPENVAKHLSSHLHINNEVVKRPSHKELRPVRDSSEEPGVENGRRYTEPASSRPVRDEPSRKASRKDINADPKHRYSPPQEVTNRYAELGPGKRETQWDVSPTKNTSSPVAGKAFMMSPVVVDPAARDPDSTTFKDMLGNLSRQVSRRDSNFARGESKRDSKRDSGTIPPSLSNPFFIM